MTDLMPILCADYKMAEYARDVRKGGGCLFVIAVPMDMLRPHEAQARSNHGQTLNGLASRGGLSACEAIAIIEDRQWHRMTVADAHAKLAALITDAGRVALLRGGE